MAEQDQEVVTIRREEQLGKIRLIVEVDVNKAVQLMLPALLKKVQEPEPKARGKKRRQRAAKESPAAAATPPIPFPEPKQPAVPAKPLSDQLDAKVAAAAAK